MKESLIRSLIREAIEQIYEKAIQYQIGDRVKIDSSYGGGIGTVELAKHPYYAIKFDQTGTTDSFHFSDLRPFDDEAEDEKDKNIDTGLDESTIKEGILNRIYHLEGILIVDAKERNQKDILSDIRSIVGVTIVRNKEMQQDPTTSSFRSTIEVKIDPYPFVTQGNNDINSIVDEVRTNIKRVKSVLGFKDLGKTYSTPD